MIFLSALSGFQVLLLYYLCSKLILFVPTGDTFTDGSVRYTMTSMNVPEPVMSLAVSPVSKDSGGQVIFYLSTSLLN